MGFKRAEAKITIGKLVQLAYSKDKGLTTKIMAKKGAAKLTVDSDGNATLSGSAGVVTFSGTPVLKQIGAKIKRVSIRFQNDSEKQGDMIIGYTASFDLGVIQLTVSGNFDLEKLITSCSGLVCIAARLFQNRNRALDIEMQKIMGI